MSWKIKKIKVVQIYFKNFWVLVFYFMKINAMYAMQKSIEYYLHTWHFLIVSTAVIGLGMPTIVQSPTLNFPQPISVKQSI